MHNSSPITFIAWDRANLAAVRDSLAGLQRDGIFLRRGRLLLETSWLGSGARDFYATAWHWRAQDCPLFYNLARRGKLLITISDTVISCGSKDDIADARAGIAQEIIAVQSPQQLCALLADAAEN
ncbi:hypothetical protein ACKFRL_03120 [Corynebacterium marquesiae]|uniref:hypothetical protein n=1 Tax=Corynebacterium marquesiae TaxID=2913503 RepID=UPI0038D03ACA